MMQFRDLKAQYRALKTDMDAAMTEVAASAAYISGPQVKELEASLPDYVGVRHCISCANGTDALTIALKVWGVGPGDAVFVPDFTFFSSAEVVSLEGATPVFYDVDGRTFNADPASLEQVVQKTVSEGRLTPKVIVAVDLFGLPADYPGILKIKEKYGLYLLEDGAQGFGGEISGRKACSFGDISTTSFFPAKPLGCYGDGGAIFTDNDQWDTLARSYCVHGKGSFKYDNVRVGMNSRLDTLQAAVLQVKLKAFREYEVDAVNKAAAIYDRRLAGVAVTPYIPDGFMSSWAQYTIILPDKSTRDGLQAALKEKGIPSMVYYPTPMHRQTVYKSLGYGDDACPSASRLCDTVLSLPMHPYIAESDIAAVCEAIKEYLGR